MAWYVGAWLVKVWDTAQPCISWSEPKPSIPLHRLLFYSTYGTHFGTADDEDALLTTIRLLVYISLCP